MAVATVVAAMATGAMAAVVAAPLAETIGDTAATTPTPEGTAGTGREADGAGTGAARDSAAAAAAKASVVRPGGAEGLPEGEVEVKTGKSPTKIMGKREAL